MGLRLFKHFDNMANSAKRSIQSIKKTLSDNSRVARFRESLVLSTMAGQQNLSIISFNSRGFGLDKQSICSKLISIKEKITIL